MTHNLTSDEWKFDTLTTRTHPLDPQTLPVGMILLEPFSLPLPFSLALPIFTSSTFILDSAQHGALLGDQYDWPPQVHDHSPFLYARWGSPTCESVQKSIADIEGGQDGSVHGSLLFPSGMSAISTVILSMVQSGDHIVVSRHIYGGAYDFFTTVLCDFNVSISWVDGVDMDAYRSNIQENTVLIYGEVVNNPLLKVMDVHGFIALGKEMNVLTILDNTFASPFLLQPIPLGVDICIHSATSMYSIFSFCYNLFQTILRVLGRPFGCSSWMCFFSMF